MAAHILPGTFPSADAPAPKAPDEALLKELEAERAARAPRTKTPSVPAGRRYRSITEQYCQATGAQAIPFPLSAYALHKGQVLLTYRDRTGARKQAFLTSRSLLKIFGHFGIPYERGAALSFLTSLKNLLDAWGMTPWEQTLRALPQAADLFRDLLPKTQVLDGHLVLTDGPEPVTDPQAARLTEGLDLTPAQSRTLFQALRQEVSTLEKLAEPAPAGLPLKGFDLLYRDGETVEALAYDREAKALTRRTAPGTYPHSQKCLPLDQGESAVPAPLFPLTGMTREGVQTLAKVLAAMAHPAQGGLFVLYTKQNREALEHLLCQVFPCLPPASATKLLQNEGRKALLTAQVQGIHGALLEPSLPTPRQKEAFLDLTQGKRMTVKDKLVPNQSFHNQLALVCVTGDEKLAEAMVGQFQATLADLTPWELPCIPGFTLSQAELTWIRRTLLPQGALWNHQKAPKAPKLAPKAVITDNELQTFLAQRCQVSQELCCSRAELYEAYAAFYRDLHGTDLTETPTLFGKRMRKQLPEAVEYKVKRYGPTKGTQLCYVGLGLTDAPAPVAPPEPPSPQQETDFRAWLETL